MRLFALTLGLALLIPAVCQAQRRSYDPYRILKSEYLQKDLKLTPAQIKRIQELSLQYEGTRALRRDEIVKQLGISDAQQKKMKEIRDAYNKKRTAAYRLYRSNRSEGRKKFEELRKENITKKLTDVLTSSQKQKFERMKGKKFDINKLFPRTQPKSKKKKRPDV